MIADITELNFPKINGKQYATLTQATINVADMGEKSITAQIKIDGDAIPDFSNNWEIAFKGEKYIMPLRIPQGNIETLSPTYDFTFQHWAIYQLKRWPFVTTQQVAAGTYLADEEVATVSLNLKDFCTLFGQVLEYYYGDTIKIELNPNWAYDKTATVVSINHSKIWEVLVNSFYELYGVRWELKASTDNDNNTEGGERYVIRVGYPTMELDHVFERGFEGGLLTIERQAQSEEIKNVVKGRGGDTNIPFRYFKDTDPDNPDFLPDPDWVKELKYAYFTNLMPATFRSYIQGWKAAHLSDTDEDGNLLYEDYTPVKENEAYAPWAYRKGFTDTKFQPVEFVADEITVNPTSEDSQVEILPGYAPYVKSGSSLAKYGVLTETLDNNDDIYPTLQGTGLDIAVDIEQIESDDVEEKTTSDAQVRNLPRVTSPFETISGTDYKVLTATSGEFTIESGKTANIDEGVKNISLKYNGTTYTQQWTDSLASSTSSSISASVGDDFNSIIIEGGTLEVVNKSTGKTIPASGIPSGTYYFRLKATVHNTNIDDLCVQIECPSPKLTEATIISKGWGNTFDIWIKNVWGSERLSGETDSQYSERVWRPVLGDRAGNEAKVMFTSGELAFSEDYEFVITEYPTPDTSKSWEDEDGVTHTSHWKLTLGKSDAELESSGFYVPSTRRQGKAGDTFVFIGTEMLHKPYVVDAEIRLADWDTDQMGEIKEIKPTFVISTDRVRMNGFGADDALVNQLQVGASVRLADKYLISPIDDQAYETLYLQSITYTYREPSSSDAALNPDIDIVLGEEYATAANPVSTMQSDISALQKQVGAISNVEQIVRSVGDKLYLRKDGISDRSLSPTQFYSLLTSGDFAAGLIGGTGWGFYKDENSKWVFEVDKINARHEMAVNSLVINQAEGRGGMEVDTAAYIEVTRVDDTSNGYVCYFDQKNGSVANLFHIDDIAYCNQWTAENEDLKFYRRKVIAIGVDNITLSKTIAEGAGVPSVGDIIIHYGNYTDANRQYVKVRDVVGGGYERYIEGLNSVNAAGIEYYYAGKQNGVSRWFVGNKDLVSYSGDGNGSFIEYINSKLSLNNVALSLSSTIGGKTISEYLNDVDSKYKYLSDALLQDTEITGGLIMSTLISLGYTTEDGTRMTLAGMNGSWQSDLQGRTIGSWWGGEMTDRFNTDDERISPTPSNAATSLVRLDGSAYFANGNIGFKKDGSGWLGNEKTGIKFGSDGALVLGSGITINITGAEGTQATLESVVNWQVGLEQLLSPCDADGNKLEGGWQEAFQSDGAGGIKAKILKSNVTFISAGDVIAYSK